MVVVEKWYKGERREIGKSLLGLDETSSTEARDVGKNRPLVSKSKLVAAHPPTPLFASRLCLIFPPLRADNKYPLPCTCIAVPITLPSILLPNHPRRRCNDLSLP